MYILMAWGLVKCDTLQDQLTVLKQTVASLPDNETPPLFHELGDGIDPTELDHGQTLASTSMGMRKKGVSFHAGSISHRVEAD